jgi:hypothetical protein
MHRVSIIGVGMVGGAVVANDCCSGFSQLAPARSLCFHKILKDLPLIVCSNSVICHCLQVLDSLMCLGPIRSSAVADVHLRESDVHASLSSTSAAAKPKPSSCLIAAVGSDRSGALAIMRRGLVADVITAVPSLQAHGAWTLHYRPSSKQRQDIVEPNTAAAAAAAVSGEDAAAAAAAEDGAALAASDSGGLASAESTEGGQAAAVDLSEQHHAFVLLSCGGQNTMVLDAGGAELSELSEDVSRVWHV